MEFTSAFGKDSVWGRNRGQRRQKTCLLGDESMSGIAARGRASPGCRRQRWTNKALWAAAQRMEAPPIAASLLAMATDGQQGGRTPQR